MSADRLINVDSAVEALLADLHARPWGQVSPSVYETGRLVALAPELRGHAERLTFLLRTQRPRGEWGPGDGYGLVPTLSAVEALLAEVRRNPGAERLAEAARCGLRCLRSWIGDGRALSTPDMPAIEVIVPSLLEPLNEHRAALGWDGGPLPPPAGLDGRALAWLRTAVAGGRPLELKLLHALEVAGPVAAGARAAALTGLGSVGASPAATAAWLGGSTDGPAYAFLDRTVERYGGSVPCAVPITVFERAWVVSSLARSGITVDDPGLAASLAGAIGEHGAATAPGLPPDADTTSMTLLALAHLGRPRELSCLDGYANGDHYVTWPGEQGRSTTVNAHVIEAYGIAGRRQAVRSVARWLHEQQRPDGSWVDRWHASPYYATAACAVALHRYGPPGCGGAVRSAVEWVLATQHEDGGWGRWGSGPEETAYALQVLLLTGARADPALRRRLDRAVGSGRRFLLRVAFGDANQPEFTHELHRSALWHDKDLYLPRSIVSAAIVTAIHLTQRDLAAYAPPARRRVPVVGPRVDAVADRVGADAARPDRTLRPSRTRRA